MSVVTAVIVMAGLVGEDQEPILLDDINAFFGDQPGLCWVDDAFGGTKHPQALIAGGGINHLDQGAFLAHLRRVPWARYDCAFAQVAMQGEDNHGFGLVEVYRAPDANSAWSE